MPSETTAVLDDLAESNAGPGHGARGPMNWFIDFIELVAAFFIGIVALDIFISVMLRYFFSVQIPDAYDFGRLLLGMLAGGDVTAHGHEAGHAAVPGPLRHIDHAHPARPQVADLHFHFIGHLITGEHFVDVLPRLFPSLRANHFRDVPANDLLRRKTEPRRVGSVSESIKTIAAYERQVHPREGFCQTCKTAHQGL